VAGDGGEGADVVRPVQEQELEHAARDREAGAEGEGGSVMETGPIYGILGVISAVLVILLLEHYDPTFRHSSKSRKLAWFVPILIVSSFMVWFFEWLRSP
jgi:hypothetical protein